MPRRPDGERAMTPAERQARFRSRKAVSDTEVRLALAAALVKLDEVMMTGMNWDRTKKQRTTKGVRRKVDTAKAAALYAFEVKRAAKSKRDPFPVVYARYSKAEKAAGRQPLPPTQWVESLRSKARVPVSYNKGGSDCEA